MNFEKTDSVSKTDYVCHECNSRFTVETVNVDQFFELYADDPHSPPRIDCDDCLIGGAFPLEYTNKHGITFKSIEKTDINGDKTWVLAEVKPQ